MPTFDVVDEQDSSPESTTNEEATANPYLKQNEEDVSQQKTEQQQTEQQQQQPTPPTDVLSNLGMRPILYGVLLVYLIGSSFLRNRGDATNQATKQNQAPVSMKDNQYNMETSYDDEFGDDDDEFGVFGDNEGASVQSHRGGKKLEVESNTEYAASNTKISMHNIKVLFCTA